MESFCFILSSWKKFRLNRGWDNSENGFAQTKDIELAKLLNIPDLQLSYITNVGAGQGLRKVGSSRVPFGNKFPRNTELYRLKTTKFGEV